MSDFQTQKLKQTKMPRIRGGLYGILLAGGILLVVAYSSMKTGSKSALQKRAIEVLQTVLDQEDRWTKVHAAEFLLATHFCTRQVQQVFERELLARQEEPKYRIGIWRVLAQAAPDIQTRQKWISRICDAFMDVQGADRIHAAETLGKLGYKPKNDAETNAFLEVAENDEGVFGAYALFVLIHSGSTQLEEKLISLLDSEDEKPRQAVAYSLRHLSKLSPETMQKLVDAEAKEPSDSMASVYLTSAACLHGSQRDLDRYKQKLVEYVKTGSKSQKYESLQCLGLLGDEEDLSLLTELLDDHEPDVRSASAGAILNIVDPAKEFPWPLLIKPVLFICVIAFVLLLVLQRGLGK